MRKVTSDMLSALIDQREWKSGNTSTHKGERGMLVRLHDNLIAIMTADTVEISAAGWATATTCDRLNAIAYEFAGVTVGRAQGRIVTRHGDTKATHHAEAWIKLARL